MSLLRESCTAHWQASPNELPIQQADGRICVPAKALNIVWGNDNRFWRWIAVQHGNNWDRSVAELVQVNYIGVTGKIDISKYLKNFSSRTYEIYWRIKFKVDAFGWDSSPIKFFVGTGNSRELIRSEMLHKYTNQIGKWHDIYGGEVNISSQSDGKWVEFGMLENESDKWKGSLLLAGVILKPKTI